MMVDSKTLCFVLLAPVAVAFSPISPHPTFRATTPKTTTTTRQYLAADPSEFLSQLQQHNVEALMSTLFTNGEITELKKSIIVDLQHAHGHGQSIFGSADPYLNTKELHSIPPMGNVELPVEQTPYFKPEQITEDVVKQLKAMDAREGGDGSLWTDPNAILKITDAAPGFSHPINVLEKAPDEDTMNAIYTEEVKMLRRLSLLPTVLIPTLLVDFFFISPNIEKMGDLSKDEIEMDEEDATAMAIAGGLTRFVLLAIVASITLTVAGGVV